MGRPDQKLHRLSRSARPAAGLLLLASAIAAGSPARAADGDITVTTRDFEKIEYNPETRKLEFILRGRNAQTKGVLIAMRDLRLEVVGADGATVKAVITSPDAEFDRSTMDIRGDNEVHYRSALMDADGVGFHASDRTRRIHVRKDVVVRIRSRTSLFQRQEAEGRGATAAGPGVPAAARGDRTDRSENTPAAPPSGGQTEGKAP